MSDIIAAHKATGCPATKHYVCWQDGCHQRGRVMHVPDGITLDAATAEHSRLHWAAETPEQAARKRAETDALYARRRARWGGNWATPRHPDRAEPLDH